jgi:chemotaxis protein MotB
MTHDIKRTILLLRLMAPILLPGCVSQSTYDNVQAQIQQLQQQNAALSAQVAADKAQIYRLQGAIKYTVNSELLFPSGGWEMSARGMQIISNITAELLPTQQNKIVVSSYSDNAPIGPALAREGITSNQILSQKRAENVMEFLISQGVKPDLVSARGFGDADPVASNNTPQGRAQNRRIEIALVPEEGVGPRPAPATLPSRLFAGPTQYPPRQFAAYGIIAFTSRAMPDDRLRDEMFCNAYIASLPFFKEVPTPIKDQMVTVWPIEANSTAYQINVMARGDRLCKEAVRAYGLVAALNAINDAKHSNAEVGGVGPFVLAWSPSEQKGRSDALVLVSDLSDITTYAQAKQVFVQWASDIVENPELWRKGWNTEKLKFVIRLWADKYGPRILKLFGAPGT